MKQFFVLSTLAVCLLLTACRPKTVKSVLETPAGGYKNIMIDGERMNVGPCEPSICINPLQPNQIVAGAVLNNVYYSEDSGETWHKQKLTSSFGVFGDPVIMADYFGNFYYAHLSDPDGTGWSSQRLLDRIVVQKSTDGGKTWNDGSYAGEAHPKDQDKHWLATDPHTGHLYLTWTEFDDYNSSNPEDKSRIMFSRSEDAAENWSPAISINQYDGNCLDNSYTTEGAVPEVGLNGEVFVTWSWGEKIWFDYSTDGGKTWQEEDIIVSEQPGGWAFDVLGIGRANGMPILKIDRSGGENHGTLYINWSDQRNGEADTDIWVSRSTDQGKTWSTPTRVNNDPAGKQQFFTWMDVDPATGHLHIVFYDRRNFSGNFTDVYYARSTDGGETWQNIKISERPFLPSSHTFFGDYNNISAVNGRIRPIWTRSENGKLSIWTALINEDFTN